MRDGAGTDTLFQLRAGTTSKPDQTAEHHPLMSFTLRPADVVVAGHTGEIALIERAYTSDDPELRALALGSFHRQKRLETERLRNALRDSAPRVRRRAAELSHRIADAESLVADLVTVLVDEPEIAEVAAFALGEIGDVAAASDLEQMALRHDDALCREAAVAALGALHTGLDTILQALHDKATVRRRAVIALAPFEGPNVDAALAKALDDRDWQVRQAAEDQLEISAENDSS